MIVVKIMGGLGNQMFQYAVGLAAAKRLDTKLLLDTSSYDNQLPGDTPRHYELNCFILEPEIIPKEKLDNLLAPKPTILNQIKSKLGKQTELTELAEKSPGFEKKLLNTKDNTYLNGWWQCPKYFENIKATLVHNFVPKNQLSPDANEYLGKILASNSCSLHVRRGDYVTNPNANKFHGLAPMEYYAKSSSNILSTNPDTTFFIFSDDIAWCKENLSLKNCVFIEGKTLKPEEEIFLMSKCKNNIIANSSFSWWGAWLNTNENQTVIAPKQWFIGSDADTSYMMPEGWTRL